MIAIPNMEKPKFCDDCFVPLSKCEYFAKDGIDHCPIIDIVTDDFTRAKLQGFGKIEVDAFCGGDGWVEAVISGERRSDEHNT